MKDSLVHLKIMVMNRIFVIASLAMALTVASCGNQSQAPNANSPNSTDSANTSNSSGQGTGTEMNSDSSRSDTMRSDSSVK